MGEGQVANRETARRHQAVSYEGEREDAAAVVRQRAGTDDGGDSRPSGVPVGVAAD